MLDVLRLVSDLQTGTAHAKVHTIHVDLAWEGFPLGRIRHVSVLILIQGHSDINLILITPFINRLGQAEESWVMAGRFFWDKALMRVIVSPFDATCV